MRWPSIDKMMTAIELPAVTAGIRITQRPLKTSMSEKVSKCISQKRTEQVHKSCG